MTTRIFNCYIIHVIPFYTISKNQFNKLVIAIKIYCEICNRFDFIENYNFVKYFKLNRR